MLRSKPPPLNKTPDTSSLSLESMRGNSPLIHLDKEKFSEREQHSPVSLSTDRKRRMEPSQDLCNLRSWSPDLSDSPLLSPAADHTLSKKRLLKNKHTLYNIALFCPDVRMTKCCFYLCSFYMNVITQSDLLWLHSAIFVCSLLRSVDMTGVISSNPSVSYCLYAQKAKMCRLEICIFIHLDY